MSALDGLHHAACVDEQLRLTRARIAEASAALTSRAGEDVWLETCVRDLKVNKIVRLCRMPRRDGDANPPPAIASVLITADGYARAYNWGEFLMVHFERDRERKPWDIKGNFGRCMDQIIWGHESETCHIDHESEQAGVAALAERAQSLPLTYLEGGS